LLRLDALLRPPTAPTRRSTKAAPAPQVVRPAVVRSVAAIRTGSTSSTSGVAIAAIAGTVGIVGVVGAVAAAALAGAGSNRPRAGATHRVRP
jgi:hypothetical protein